MNRFFVCVAIILLKITVAANAQTVTLDYYFNHETHKTAAGIQRFHYMWDDKQSSGFSIWGDLFKQNGMKLDTLDKAPTKADLHNTNIYIIVDPDTKKETANPNYIQPNDADEIAAWVKAGGVLVLMANDSANVELPHFNTLTANLACILIMTCLIMLLTISILKMAKQYTWTTIFSNLTQSCF